MTERPESCVLPPGSSPAPVKGARKSSRRDTSKRRRLPGSNLAVGRMKCLRAHRAHEPPRSMRWCQRRCPWSIRSRDLDEPRRCAPSFGRTVEIVGETAACGRAAFAPWGCAPRIKRLRGSDHPNGWSRLTLMGQSRRGLTGAALNKCSSDLARTLPGPALSLRPPTSWVILGMHPAVAADEGRLRVLEGLLPPGCEVFSLCRELASRQRQQPALPRARAQPRSVVELRRWRSGALTESHWQCASTTGGQPSLRTHERSG